MSTPEHMPMASFVEEHLAKLEPDMVALHGQLFPGVYPPDIELHQRIKAGFVPTAEGPYFDIIRHRTGLGAHIQRLRALPANLNDDVPAMVTAAAMAEAAGEEVRLCRFSKQLLGNLAAQGVAIELRKELQQPVPRKGFWSVRKNELDDAAVVGLMDYGPDGVMRGIEVYTGNAISDELHNYTGFWHNQFLESVPPTSWQQLYS